MNFIMTTYFILTIAMVLCMTLVQCTDRTAAGRLSSTSEPPMDKYSVAPIADCSGPVVDFGAQARECFLECVGEPEPISAVTIGIAATTGEGPLIVECQKLRMTQTFTQTWTFSTVSGDLTTEHLPVSEKECMDTINDRCPSLQCDIREPDKLEEEYHYASVTTQQSTMITLVTSPSALYLDYGRVYVTPTGSTEHFIMSEGKGSAGKSFFAWKPTDTLKTCPFNTIGLYGCDHFRDKEEDFYSCDGGRFTVTPRKGKSDVWAQGCPGLKMAEEGFLYNHHIADAKGEKKGRLAVEALDSTKEAEDTSYLRHKIQQVSKKLDADICVNRCELLTVESRLHLTESRLVRAGMESYLMLPNGTAQYCKPNHGCRLPEKPTYCGNPPRLTVLCNGYTRYWNPLLPYTAPGSKCMKPDPVEELVFNLGTTHYNIDSDLKIKIPNKDYHHRYPNSFLEYHNSALFLDVKSLKELKAGWQESKVVTQKGSATMIKETSIEAPHVSIGGSILNAAKGLYTGFKSLEAIIGVVFVCAVIIFSLFVLGKVTDIYKKIKKPYQPVIQRGIELETPDRDIIWT